MNFPIRPAAPTDRSYIIKSWVCSMRRQFPFSAMCKDAMSKYSKRVEALLETSRVYVACDPKMDDVVYGFIVFEDGEYLGRDAPTLHFIWTRRQFRQSGIATALMRKSGLLGRKITYTHITKDLKNANIYKKWGLTSYDPYYVEGAIYTRARMLDAKALLWTKAVKAAPGDGSVRIPGDAPA